MDQPGTGNDATYDSLRAQVDIPPTVSTDPLGDIAAVVAALSDKFEQMMATIQAQRDWAGGVEKRLHALSTPCAADVGPFQDQPTGEQQAALFEALAKWQATKPTLDKARTATVRSEKGNFSYRFADLSDVIEVAQSAATYGLSTYQPQLIINGQTVARAYLVHQGGGFIFCDAPVLVRQAGRSFSAGQDWAAAYSFARRYALCGVLGIAAGIDDDDNTPQQQQGQRTASSTSAPGGATQQQRSGSAVPVRRTQPVAAERQAPRPAAAASAATGAHAPAAPGWSNTVPSSDPTFG
jgi:hypothetical protein